MRAILSLLPVAVVIVLCAGPAAGATDYSQTHEVLPLNVGITPTTIYTTTQNYSLPLIGGITVKVELNGKASGTALNLAVNGDGKLTFPKAPGKGDLWFQGGSSSASQNIVVEYSGRVGIDININLLGLPITYTGWSGYFTTTPEGLLRTLNFTAYQQGNSLTLTQQVEAPNLINWNFGGSTLGGSIVLGVRTSDSIPVALNPLNTDKGVFTSALQHIEQDVSSPTFTVGNIFQNVGINSPTMTFTPHISGDAHFVVLGQPFSYPFNADLSVATVELKGMPASPYTTTPARSITFQIPHWVNSFALNGGAVNALGLAAILNNDSTNGPLEYAASEDVAFPGASWYPYSTAPLYTLSAGDGPKHVYFKVRSAAGESNMMEDIINVVSTVPTVNALVTKDTTPALSGTVAEATAVVSVTVGTQTLTAANNGDGTWTLQDNLLSALADGTYDVLVSAVDAGANTLWDATANELIVDTVQPTISLATSAPDPTPAPIIVNITLSEPCPGFDAGDLDIYNVTVSNFTGGGTSYSMTLSPYAQGYFSCQVNPGAFSDPAGNPNEGSNVISGTYDTLPPTATLNTTATDPTNNAITVSVTLSEACADFSAGCFTLQNASLSDFSGGGTGYSFTLTPIAEAAFSCVVNAASFHDAAGNANDSASNTITRVYDGTPPTVTMASTAANPTNVSPIPVTVHFSEPVVDFDALAVQVLNGAVNNFAGSGSDYSFDLVPAATGTVTATIPAGAAHDPAGSGNPGAAVLSRDYDNVRPTVSMTSGLPNPTNQRPVAVTVVFSKPVTGFTAADITTANAFLFGFSGSGANYSFSLTPQSLGSFSASIPEGAALDSALNPNEPGQFISVFDNALPSISQVIAVPAKAREGAPVAISITASEALRVSSTVSVNGHPAIYQSNAGLVYTYAYVVGASDPDGPATISIQATDLAGNSRTVSNNTALTIDKIAPTAVITLQGPAHSTADTVSFSVVFSESVAGTFTEGDVTLVSGSLAGTPSVSGADSAYTISVALANPDADGTVAVVLSGPGISDGAGNTYAGGLSPTGTVHNWPGFATEPSELHLYLQDSPLLAVSVDEAGVATGYQWYREDNESKTIHTGPAAASWQLSDISAADEGDYWCVVTYDGQPHPSARGTLHVAPHVTLTGVTVDGEARIGRDMTLTAEATGGYPPLTYLWYKDGAEVNSGHILVFDDLAGQDSGEYQVIVTDYYGDHADSDPIQISVDVQQMPAAGLAGLVTLVAVLALGGAATRRKRN